MLAGQPELGFEQHPVQHLRLASLDETPGVGECQDRAVRLRLEHHQLRENTLLRRNHRRTDDFGIEHPAHRGHSIDRGRIELEIGRRRNHRRHRADGELLAVRHDDQSNTEPEDQRAKR
ncbi:hypothetical protein HFP89_10290 [Wenzhouxiangella sp. XN79A]|uniref:hypothetical protein n=1 Tax=Wenzhouxiangella sp. XN79A TaxID=2724193 RepID=UPI00144AC644|nr:hypothetical protein [Wenzhouxiangella sp. XN79A]NKI35554.1 hypothetical protein [Wenzhouxiangella sp. XN79A]